uniref:Transcription factor 24 n=1 Tax=Podarcis muralis TaxID=64176 RepID=A0A670IFC0_PODMU
MDYRNVSENCKELTAPCSNSSSLPASVPGTDSSAGQRTAIALGRPAAANAARERSRVQTLRHAFLELQRTLPSVPPDTKLSKLDVLLLATTYIAHLTRSLQDEEELPGEGLGTLRGDGYLHPVKVSNAKQRGFLLLGRIKEEHESFCYLLLNLSVALSCPGQPKSAYNQPNRQTKSPTCVH